MAMRACITTDPTGATISKVDMSKGGVFDQLHADDEFKSLGDLLKKPANNNGPPPEAPPADEISPLLRAVLDKCSDRCIASITHTSATGITKTIEISRGDDVPEKPEAQSQLEAELQASQSKGAELAAQLKASESEATALRKRVAELTATLEAERTKNERMTASIEALEHEGSVAAVLSDEWSRLTSWLSPSAAPTASSTSPTSPASPAGSSAPLSRLPAARRRSMSGLSVVHAGFLSKRGDYHGRWQPRWCVLQRSGDLHYYLVDDGKQSGDAHRGVITLSAATQGVRRLAPDSERDFSFSVTTAGRVWKLDPGDQASFAEWNKHISALVPPAVR